MTKDSRLIIEVLLEVLILYGLKLDYLEKEIIKLGTKKEKKTKSTPRDNS